MGLPPSANAEEDPRRLHGVPFPSPLTPSKAEGAASDPAFHTQESPKPISPNATSASDLGPNAAGAATPPQTSPNATNRILKRGPGSSFTIGDSTRGAKRLVAEVRTGMEVPRGAGDPCLTAEDALRNAVLTNAEEDARSLLEKHSVNPNAADDRGRTALHFATSNGNASIVKLLILHGADVEAADANGNRPLHLAVISNHMTIVLELLKAGAQLESSDKRDKTPLDLAASWLAMIKKRSASELPTWQMGAPRNAHERWGQDMNFAGWTREDLITHVGEILVLLRYSVPKENGEINPLQTTDDDCTPNSSDHRRKVQSAVDSQALDELTARLAGLATSARPQPDSEVDEVVNDLGVLLEKLKVSSTSSS